MLRETGNDAPNIKGMRAGSMSRSRSRGTGNWVAVVQKKRTVNTATRCQQCVDATRRCSVLDHETLKDC